MAEGFSGNNISLGATGYAIYLPAKPTMAELDS